MAELLFEKVINLTTSDTNVPPTLVRNLCMVNEPDNELVQYYIDTNNLAEDKAANIVYSNYETALWGNKGKRLTSRNVSRIGVKAFPRIGAIAFFKYMYENRSFILCPVNHHNVKFTAPTLTMIVKDGQITFTIKPPKDVTYQCYRIVLSNKYFTIEYVTYNTILSVPCPEVKGTYNIYCIGYVEEGQVISFDSNLLKLDITSGKDTFEPDPTISYYTKEQIDNLFATVLRNYVGDNITISVDNDTKVISIPETYRKLIENNSKVVVEKLAITTVTASSYYGSGYEPALTLDGNTTTRWASLNKTDEQYLVFDLGTSRTIDSLKGSCSSGYITETCEIFISVDGNTYTNIGSITITEASILTEGIITTGNIGRYIKLLFTSTANSNFYELQEFEVYGY